MRKWQARRWGNRKLVIPGAHGSLAIHEREGDPGFTGKKFSRSGNVHADAFSQRRLIRPQLCMVCSLRAKLLVESYFTFQIAGGVMPGRQIDGLQVGLVKLELDGRWDFEEFYQTARDYIQLYGFSYSLLAGLPTSRLEELDYIYGKFPWRGGYSAVNFFNQLFHRVPPSLRPEVKRLQYASPGFMELQELVLVAIQVATIVGSLSLAIKPAYELYRKILRDRVDLHLTKLDAASKELELTKQQIEFCKTGASDLVKVLGLTEEQEALLEHRSLGNPLTKLKILLSVFRRAHPLAEKQCSGLLKISKQDADFTPPSAPHPL
jgi:hypothetical protein